MKKLIPLFLSIFILLSSCSDDSKVVIDGIDTKKDNTTKVAPEVPKDVPEDKKEPEDSFTTYNQEYKTCGMDLPKMYNLKELKNIYKAHDAQVDEYAQFIGGYALYIFGVGKFKFTSHGLLMKFVDGYAHLRGYVYNESNPAEILKVSVILKDRRTGETPKKELKDIAYDENGGPVDTDDWAYYTLEAGLFEGSGDLVGTCLDITQNSMAFQIGFGANGRNITFGASSWFTILTAASSKTKLPPYWKIDGDGDINIDLERPYCIKNAVSDDYAMFTRDHTLWLAGIGFFDSIKDQVLMLEFPNNTAKIKGPLKVHGKTGWNVDLEMDLSDKTTTAPAGSPYKELFDAAYSENGGPVDVSKWRYYQTFEGTLTGKDKLKGLVIKLTKRGPAMQLGVGANGTNDNNGGSSWVNYEIVSQPDNEDIRFEANKGDLNFDFYFCKRVREEYEPDRYPRVDDQ
ncbi:MAG: hypothetical protein H6621_07045 [Halobacteriovoraceae bacterium]|nr:hypothetical protein [Halobacteriovoraceae bacterium]